MPVGRASTFTYNGQGKSLHHGPADGRTTDLERAIREHSSNGSEANGAITNFNNLSASRKQDLLNFLRSL